MPHRVDRVGMSRSMYQDFSLIPGLQDRERKKVDPRDGPFAHPLPAKKSPPGNDQKPELIKPER